MDNKIISLRYPDTRDVFHHPETKEDFAKLMDQLMHFQKIDDCNGVFTTAMQLIPNRIELDDGTDNKEIDLADPAQVAKVLQHFANSFSRSYKTKELAYILTTDKTHRQLQSYIFEIFLACIKSWATGDGGVDERNRKAHDKSAKMLLGLEGL